MSFLLIHISMKTKTTDHSMEAHGSMKLHLVLFMVVISESSCTTLLDQVENSEILKHSSLLVELISRSFVNRTCVLSIYSAPKSITENNGSVFQVAGKLLRELTDDFTINFYLNRWEHFDWDYNVIVSDSIMKIRWVFFCKLFFLQNAGSVLKVGSQRNFIISNYTDTESLRDLAIFKKCRTGSVLAYIAYIGQIAYKS